MQFRGAAADDVAIRTRDRTPDRGRQMTGRLLTLPARPAVVEDDRRWGVPSLVVAAKDEDEDDDDLDEDDDEDDEE